MHDSIIHLPNLDNTKKYSITVENVKAKPNFTMTGNKMKSLDIIANFSKPEAMVFIHLKDSRDYETNYVRFSTSNLTSTEKVIFSKGYKALEAKQLVVRIKKGVTSTYLFNPDFIIPSNYTETMKEWNKLTDI